MLEQERRLTLALHTLPPLAAEPSFDITLEPQSGSATPTGAVLYRGSGCQTALTRGVLYLQALLFD